MAASLCTLSLLLIAGAVAQTCESNQLKVSYPAPIAADGWEYRLVAQGMKKPRSLLFDSDGALIVLDAGVGILRFSLQDDGGSCVSVARNATLLANKDVTGKFSLNYSASNCPIYLSILLLEYNCCAVFTPPNRNPHHHFF
jgi:glucose/arabinose dehydrogenase